MKHSLEIHWECENVGINKANGRKKGRRNESTVVLFQSIKRAEHDI
jgi:hypothetical protein